MSEKVKVGLIGAGGIAQGAHLRGYHSIPDECEVVWICDVNQEVAEKAAAKVVEAGGAKPQITTDYKQMLTDSELDAVSVTTPNKYHVEPTVDALNAGKHVLCEKPLGMNADECRRMCAAARENKKILQVALQNRFTGAARFAKQYIDGGNMGDIYYARAWALRRRGVPAWGVFIHKDQQGGGPLIDIGVHILDFTLYLMGYPKPVSASGQTWDILGKTPGLYNPWGDYDRTKFTVEDFAVGLIRFENGAVVSLESSFMANLDGDPFKASFFGTKAGMDLNPWGADPVKIYTEQDGQLFNMVGASVPHVESAHVDEVKAFIKAIREDLPSPVPGENGLYLNAIFDALYKSAETKKEEPIDVSF
ncbi:MAG: Gfo/Idh/MocA family oxidoreductase [Fimbriimonadaceae bacterium]|nr:Gfo/Idh/MocA family oxidoreductase [Fimbriimonadaceae bacterium]